jgi:adenylate cyclase
MRRKFLFGVLSGLGGAAVALALWFAGALDALEWTTWGVRVRALAGPSAHTPAIKLILLDQDSLDWGKQVNRLSWPWPREVYVPLINFCVRGGARAIAFDVVFTEPSVYDVADDEAFAAGIAAAPGFVGAVFLGNQTGDATQWLAEAAAPRLPLDGLAGWLRTDSRAPLVMSRAAFPVAELAAATPLLGSVAETPDADGIIRRASLFHVFDGRAVPTLGAAAFFRDLDGEAAPVMRLAPRGLRIGDRLYPLDRRGKAILRYRGAPDAYQTFNAAEVIQSELRIQAGEVPALAPEVFTNAYVFFGFSAPGLLDLRPTPVSPVTPGVFVHATLLDNLLTWDLMRDAPAPHVAAGTLLLALAGGGLVACSRKARQSVLAFLLVLPVAPLLGFAAYRAGVWWPVIPQALAAALAMLSAVVINYATEGRQKAFIKQAFRHYLGRDVIEQILADPSRLRLGGEKRELTLLFSDIEKFSGFSEQLDPPTLTALLNDYLTDMSAIIQAEGGYLDKYIGDAIVAFWNAPLGQSDHALRAVRAAIRCQRRLAERRGELEQRYGAVIRARIGINTGEVVVGNMGSYERFNYTVLGDAANLASRLEGANKAFGTFTLIAEATRRQAGDRIIARELGRLRVVGREQPVQVYEPLGLAGEAVPAAAGEFERGRQLCAQGQWRAALSVFEGLPHDPVAAVYARRCRQLAETPGAAWDGIWNLTEKG